MFKKLEKLMRVRFQGWWVEVMFGDIVITRIKRGRGKKEIKRGLSGIYSGLSDKEMVKRLIKGNLDN
jgi:hypothetical protein